METRRTTERAVPRQPEPAPVREPEKREAEPHSAGAPPPSPSQDEADALKEHAVGEGEGTGEPEPEPVAPTNVDVPLVTGAGSVGSTLNCTMGNWNNEPSSYSYQWKQDNTTNVGTNSNNYVIAAGDAGRSLTCVVTATNAAGSATAPPSNAVAVPAA